MRNGKDLSSLRAGEMTIGVLIDLSQV